MDGLPKYKAPPKKDERPSIALDDYFFERKLQEVYDKKPASNDMPALLKVAARRIQKTKHTVSKLVKKRSKKALKTETAKITKKKPVLINEPYTAKKRFTTNKQTVQPKTKKQKRIFTAFSKRSKKTKIAIVMFVFMVAGLAASNAVSSSKKVNDTPSVAGATSAQKPDFDTLLPGNAPEAKVKFDPTRKVASFEDTIENGRIVISQQQLSEKDIVDPNFLSRTATAFNLKTEVTTKKGQAFIGVNIEKNTQFVMFIYKDFLLFIQTETSYKNQVLVEYIDALK